MYKNNMNSALQLYTVLLYYLIWDTAFWIRKHI